MCLACICGETSLKWTGYLEQSSEDSEKEPPNTNSDQEISNSSNSKDKDPSLRIENYKLNFQQNWPIKSNDGKDDVLVVPGTKVGTTFSASQFYVNGFTNPYRLDRNRNGGGVFIYFCENIPNKKLENYIASDIQGMFIELNLRKTKWLLLGCYHPQYKSNNCFFYGTKNDFNKLRQKPDKCIIVGDFNSEDSKTCL